jgi:hypothetical protein
VSADSGGWVLLLGILVHNFIQLSLLETPVH